MKPNKYTRRTDLYNRLAALGFTMEEADKLRRIEKTLHRWAEHECNGNIQRDEKTDRPKWYWSDGELAGCHYIADRERGALKRLEAIVEAVNLRLVSDGIGGAFDALHAGDIASVHLEKCQLWFYHQTDPRGCSVFIGRKSDLRQGQDVSGCYSSLGVAVCD